MSLTTQLSIPKRPALRWIVSVFLSLGVAVFTSAQSPASVVSASQPNRANAVLLETLSWDEAEHVLTPDPVEKKVRQSGGTHADEIETSMILYIAPESVRMKKAVRDLNPNQPGGLTRDPQGKGIYSPTGAWGDPTLATREKGQAVTESLVSTILKDIDDLRQTPLPPAK